MVTVAFIGASGLGRTMLMNILHHNNNKHRLVLLSRSEQPEITARGVEVRPTKYDDHQDLVRNLQGVHTVLSFVGAGGLGGPDDNVQLRIIKACQDAGVKRFAPSEYAGDKYAGIDLYAPKAEVWEATQKSGLEYTRFSCGLFMSVMATGTPKPLTDVGTREGRETGEEEALAGLRPWNFIINMKAGTADMPGDGTAPLVLTDIRDISLFVLRALDMDKWPEDLGMRGDVKSFAEIVQICEKVQKRKWLMKNTSVEELQANRDEPGMEFYNQTRLAIANGWGMVGDELNKEFPDVKPMTCEEFVEKWWGGIELGEASWGEDRAFGAKDM